MNTKGEYMKESNIFASNVTKHLLRKEVWLNTKGLYMKELNTLAEIVSIKQLQRKV